MTVGKVLNYVTAVIAMIHAGTTSFFTKQLNQIDYSAVDFTSYDELLAFANTLPDSYVVATGLMLLTGLVLFIFGIVTLIFNFKLDNRLRIKRIAIWTSLATIFGVFIGLTPIANTVHAVLLAVLYVISGYFTRDLPKEV